MYDLERERRMPLFILISMLLHALLFLFAPQLLSGVLSGMHAGDQGGLTYITLVDVAVPETPRAAVAEAARRPQATAAPRPLPEPARPAESRAETTPAPAQTQPQATVPEVRAELVQPQPQEERPQAVTPAPAQPAPEPAPRPDPVPEPFQSTTSEIGQAEATASLQPVLTAVGGPRTLPTVAAPPRVEESPGASEAATAVSGPPAASEEAAGAPSGGAEPGGTGAPEDVSSALPNAEVSAVPAMPPTGVSMIRAAGGLGWPKNFVGVLTRTLTVEVAVIVDPAGNVLETVVTQSSGVEYIDDYSRTVASRGITYRPYDEIYEIRVVLVYDPDERSLSHRVDGFIKAPPTVGSHAR